MKILVTAFIAISALAVAAIAFAVFFRTMAAVMMYDANFEVFHHTLSRDQADAIIRTSQAQMGSILLLLVVTNVFWFGFAIYALLRLQNLPSAHSAGQ